ncbi:hypothetical protein [Citrobacter freundii]|uniref:hypothetical protein n=1 Tax=Citrobacter freundii TaxID=546 RepID=UPI0022326B60|nr:hypothetical protein [Citrobacter freundii]BDT23213.1 hypothetical protein CF204P1_19360 [Citrobacter freundii]
MTAEIAVYNSSAIALAADSAVTIVSDGTVKINNSADKLFELSKHHPVGVMIFNNASLAGAPWELIIKAYRKQLAASPKNTILEYSNDFINFIQVNKFAINDNMRQKSAEMIFVQKLIRIRDKINQFDIVNLLKSKGEDVNTQDFNNFLLENIILEIQSLNNNDFFLNLDESDIAEARDYVKSFVGTLTPQILPSDPQFPLSEQLCAELEEFAALLLCKQHDSESFTGVVFAGYGEQEYYPSMRTVHIYGVFNDKLLYNEDKAKTKESNSDLAGIYPFAQEEEVIAFIKGCSQSVNGFADKLVEEVANKAKNFMADNLKQLLNDNDYSLIKQNIEQHFNCSISDFKNKKNTYIQNTHVAKMLSMLNSLGKVDLAYMAETLVDITAFKRKISNDHETVGGPVDVAVISKGDGFVWIQRKHYFSKDLNHNFFERSSNKLTGEIDDTSTNA